MQGRSARVQRYSLLSSVNLIHDSKVSGTLSKLVTYPYVRFLASSKVSAKSCSLSFAAGSGFLSLIAVCKIAATSLFALRMKPTSRSLSLKTFSVLI